MWGTFSQTEGSKISDLFVFFPRKKKKRERERERKEKAPQISQTTAVTSKRKLCR